MVNKKLIPVDEFFDKVEIIEPDMHIEVQDDLTVKEFVSLEDNILQDFYENRIIVVPKEYFEVRNLKFHFKFQKEEGQSLREKYGQRLKNAILKRLEPSQNLEDAYKIIAKDFNSSTSSVEQVLSGNRPFRVEYFDYLYKKWGIHPYEIVGLPKSDVDVNQTLKDLDEMMQQDADESIELNELLSKLRLKLKGDPSMVSRIHKINELIKLIDSL